ncbi:hypothetical protein [Campylobacter cuniculorum]|uniref:Uncharacterized protein n=1 Tax=Campylobacter cuniculorum DSM 23162 = LMG 24588 TaxID=1121267 RepID=A0A1W6BX50_9BACT|nr:hypothetical protein [Campylobacter cuniculorum]ARJ56683.1 hypothetical protein CCUN_1085 [Campylobacter cuniculorum DSM 23162 = LMG 24588]
MIIKYYATIYVDELLEDEMLKHVDFSLLFKAKFSQISKQIDLTHAFLGLTKGKSPNELDEQDKELRQEKLKNIDWKDFDKKWYEAKEANEFNDGFWGFGTGTGAVNDTAGKVFNNNQYVLDNNVNKNCYIIKKLRSSQTFYPSNRCTLEISQEQYETLLTNIKDDFNTTKEITPNSQKPINEEFTYKLLENNCVTWVIQKLSDIGIEVINIDEWIPDAPMVDDLKENLDLIKSLHSIFLKFQNIDDNLQSVKGAKAFRDWARMLINNSLMQEIYLDEYKKQYNNENLSLEQKEVLYALWNITRAYKTLENLLERLIIKSNTKNLKGDFELIYFDRKDRQIKLLKASNDYEAIIIQDLDLSQKYNNFSVSKFYPFIFIPKDEMISRMLYHKYDYGNISQEYQKDRNEFYFNVLAGEKSDKYWSSSYHKMTKNLRKIHVS